ncbi:DUF2000 domain-containing protein [Nocardiopsis mangrovi]|uniref:DUF2000 domain-containing protein n=1 Tax=Nocardiopsis mangrovi TaxID=1179818 RepID=A0ABV9E1Z4_9ACTN
MDEALPAPAPGDTTGAPAACVLIVDDALPRWLAANTAAVLGVALGAHGLIGLGPELPDADGVLHPGIGDTPLPVLASPREGLPALRAKARESGLFVVDFNDAARLSRNYGEYKERLAAGSAGYLGLALHGSRKAVRSISGNLKSLR